jgi:hypothetical protein
MRVFLERRRRGYRPFVFVRFYPNYLYDLQRNSGELVSERAKKLHLHSVVDLRDTICEEVPRTPRQIVNRRNSEADPAARLPSVSSTAVISISQKRHQTKKTHTLETLLIKPSVIMPESAEINQRASLP